VVERRDNFLAVDGVPVDRVDDEPDGFRLSSVDDVTDEVHDITLQRLLGEISVDFREFLGDVARWEEIENRRDFCEEENSEFPHSEGFR
jgi:hypothetical protein